MEGEPIIGNAFKRCGAGITNECGIFNECLSETPLPSPWDNSIDAGTLFKVTLLMHKEVDAGCTVPAGLPSNSSLLHDYVMNSVFTLECNLSPLTSLNTSTLHPTLQS